MTTSEKITAAADYRTRMFARVIGPFLVVLTATAMFRAPQVWKNATAMQADPVLLWSVGSFTLLAGLTVLALHPYWHSPAAICVSLTGWITVLKGFALTVFPDAGAASANAAMRAEGWVEVVYVLFALIGLYLTYVGWAPTSSERVHEPARR